MADILLLGPVEVWQRGRRVALGHARQRCVLAILAVEPNKLVLASKLIERVWGKLPPDGAHKTIQAYISRLRRAIGGTEGIALGNRGGGYLFDIGDSQTDIRGFRSLVGAAREAAATGDDNGAAALFDKALGMWRGDALADLAGHWADGVRAQLAEERFAALEGRLDADLNLGRHAWVVGELTALVHAYPWRERLAGQLMLALYRDGRQSEALRVYHVVRNRLADDGLDPGPALRQVELAILRADAALRVHRAGEPGAPADGVRFKIRL
ncbi:AfsR/SARP family transcriptional regulator [Phytohabitans aurantiacus]|jgi:DNA-binding SARP family transcriptional activator|uniref:OmpR/PhoB-type domain-containing protein n=1 Tax=Phytohabitans aurantiacus TaxID=3016789 RepID=A0ABQ5R747_9ACTN|nr:AfsR/SARP family transcriptional regulator [Phytohabitans aurantiacus]GLI02582.1 hypothetical protein Pa4123_78600 [Phytohabitans aurantiacus]